MAILRYQQADGTSVDFVVDKSNPDIMLGRSPQCKLQINDRSLSRLHARIWLDEDGVYHLLDLDSLNGVWCNGKKIRETVLNGDAQLVFGNLSMDFILKPPRKLW